MFKRCKFIVVTFVVALLIFALNRVVFIVYNHHLAEGCTLWELVLTMLHGLKLDSTTAGYITAIPLLITVATIWLPQSKGVERSLTAILNCYFALVVAVVAVIETADIGMFSEWQSRIDAQVLIYSPREMLASVSLANGAAALTYIAVMTALGVVMYRYVVSRLFMPIVCDDGSECYCRHRIIGTIGMTLLAGALFIVIRGGVTTATANVSKAYFSSKMFLNQTAVNPIFSLLSSLLSKSEFSGYEFYPDAEMRSIFNECLHSEIPHNATSLEHERWINTSRPNIVLIIVEGMGRTITDTIIDGEAVTPNIERLKSEGVWFEYLYASSFRTDRGTVATLSGFPSQPKMSIMKYPTKAAHLPSIAQSLADNGYVTRFYYGGDANFTNTRAYLYATGFSEVIDEDVLTLDGHRSKWGYADDAVLGYVADYITSRNEPDTPHLDVVLTLSSHEPFEVPYARLDDPTLNAFAFTDNVIGSFIERLRSSDVWQESIIIIIPDHGYPYPATVGNNSPERHHIPMLWLGGAVNKGVTVERYMSQTDLAATLLAQLDIPHTEYMFSRNIAAKDAGEFGYWTFNDGFGIIDSCGVTIYDHTQSRCLREDNDDNHQRLRRGKALLQMTMSEVAKL